MLDEAAMARRANAWLDIRDIAKVIADAL